ATAEAGAGLVVDQLRACLGKRVAGIERVVAKELPDGAVELVGPPPGHELHLDRGAAALGAEVRGQDAYLRDRVDVREGDAAVGRRVVAVDAVDGEAGLVRALTEPLDSMLARGAPRHDPQELHPRDEIDEGDRVTADDGKVADLALLDGPFDRRLLGLEQ